MKNMEGKLDVIGRENKHGLQNRIVSKKLKRKKIEKE